MCTFLKDLYFKTQISFQLVPLIFQRPRSTIPRNIAARKHVKLHRLLLDFIWHIFAANFTFKVPAWAFPASPYPNVRPPAAPCIWECFICPCGQNGWMKRPQWRWNTFICTNTFAVTGCVTCIFSNTFGWMNEWMWAICEVFMVSNESSKRFATVLKRWTEILNVMILMGQSSCSLRRVQLM